MEYNIWKQLSEEMTVETIVRELTDLMIPYAEGKLRAKALLNNKSQEALNVQHLMGQALIVLEELGYEIKKK